MTTQRYSDAYVAHLSAGPFPGRIDPWAEDDHFFHQLHAGMIGELLQQLRLPLKRIGYLASREASLQIVEQRQPDIAVRFEQESAELPQPWDYPAAAAAVLAEPGIVVEGAAFELHAVYIKRADTGKLVTVVEIISPGNKNRQSSMDAYIDRRDELIRGKHINVVEIDLTRSYKRLLNDLLATSYAYHVAIFLPHDFSRLIGMDFGSPLKRFALPLHEEVVGIDLQPIYDHAYLEGFIADQMLDENDYAESTLPFPTLLTAEQRRDSLDAVARWKEELARLREEKGE